MLDIHKQRRISKIPLKRGVSEGEGVRLRTATKTGFVLEGEGEFIREFQATYDAFRPCLRGSSGKFVINTLHIIPFSDQ